MSSLQDLAATEGLSISELIRQSVDSLLRQRLRKADPQAKRRAVAAVGRFRSGHSDLATDHDRHLDEAFRD